MATYYIGNPADKRKRLIAAKDGVYLDNDEVLAAYAKDNRYVFVVAKPAFADFSIWEYLSYSKSLELKRPLRMDEASDLVTRMGINISLKTKLKKLDPITIKAVKLAAALKPDTRRISLNLDGLRYSRKLNRRLKNLVTTLSDYQLVISISDIRYVPKDGAIEWFPDARAKPQNPKQIKESKSALKL